MNSPIKSMAGADPNKSAQLAQYYESQMQNPLHPGLMAKIMGMFNPQSADLGAARQFNLAQEDQAANRTGQLNAAMSGRNAQPQPGQPTGNSRTIR